MLIGLGIVLLVAVVGISVGVFVSSKDHKGGVHKVLAEEVKKLEGLSFDEFKELCTLQPQTEVVYDSERFIRTFTETKYDEIDKVLKTRVTVSSAENRSLSDYELMTRFDTGKSKIYEDGFKKDARL